MQFGTKKAALQRNAQRCGRCGYYVLVDRKKAEVACGSCGQKLKVDVVGPVDSDEPSGASPVSEPVALDYVAPDVEPEP